MILRAGVHGLYMSSRLHRLWPSSADVWIIQVSFSLQATSELDNISNNMFGESKL